MAAIRLLVISLILLSQNTFIGVTQAATQTNYYDLLDFLFTDYRRDVRPVTDDSNATRVYINFWLLSIVGLDEQNQILSLSVIIEMEWTDDWLSWDPATYGGIESIRYPQDELWLPDVVVYNSVTSQTQLGYKESPCSVINDGEVTWRPSEIIQTSCDMDVTYYPFDKQSCTVLLSTWVSDHNTVDLELDDEHTAVILTRYSTSGTWELLSTSMEVLPDDGGLTRLQYTFNLKRRSTFFVLNIILPILLLSFTASTVFFLPAESGEKIGMSMTVLLSFAVYLTIISENMPQTSLKVSILSVYLVILLGVCGLSVIMSVLILHIHHCPPEKPIGAKTVNFTRRAKVFLCRQGFYKNDRDTNSRNSDTNRNNNLMKQHDIMDPLKNASVSETLGLHKRVNGKVAPLPSQEKKRRQSKLYDVRSLDDDIGHVTWPMVAEVLDTIFFLATTVFIVLFTIVIMVMLVVGGSI